MRRVAVKIGSKGDKKDSDEQAPTTEEPVNESIDAPAENNDPLRRDEV
jgi:hypothetical protein